jgi:hypothetical protein
VALAGEVGKGGASDGGGAARGCLDEDRVARTFWTGSSLAFFVVAAVVLEEPILTPTPCLAAQISFLFFLGDFGLVGEASPVGDISLAVDFCFVENFDLGDFGFEVGGASVSVSVPGP